MPQHPLRGGRAAVVQDRGKETMLKELVIGGAGFVGLNIAARFLQAVFRVEIFERAKLQPRCFRRSAKRPIHRVLRWQRVAAR